MTVNSRTHIIGWRWLVLALTAVASIALGADFSGSIVANTANLSGGAGFHYDQSLNSNSSGKSTFQMISWIEDIEQLAPQP